MSQLSTSHGDVERSLWEAFPPVSKCLLSFFLGVFSWSFGLWFPLVTVVSFGLSPNSRNDANRACVLNVANIASAISNFLEENTFN